MLGRTFNTVVPFAQELAEVGIALQAMPSSILSELCSLSAPLEFQRDREVPKTVPNEVSAYSMALDLNTTGNDAALWGTSFDHTVSELSTLLKNHISYIRNVVIPRTKEFEHDASLFLQELGASNPASELEICRSGIPEFAQDPSFLSLLDPFKFKKPAAPGSYSLGFNLLAPVTDFLTIASTSNARIDGMVDAWNKSSDIQYLESVFYTFFAGPDLAKTFKGPFLSQDDLLSPSPYVRLNVSLAYFLMANYYSHHLPDMVTKEDTSSLKRRLFDHLSYAGAVACDALMRIEQNSKTNILVTYIDTFHKKITVSGDVYDRWLATGGSAETIMGILVGTKRYYSVSEIDANAKELQHAWSNYTKVYVEMIELKKASSMRGFYLSLFNKYLGSDYQDFMEKSYLQANSMIRDSIKKEAEAFLQTLKKEALCNTTYVAKELIAGMKYRYTYAKKFIDDMEAIGASSDKAIPEEAALIATINYIVDYLHLQISPVKVQ